MLRHPLAAALGCLFSFFINSLGQVDRVGPLCAWTASIRGNFGNHEVVIMKTRLPRWQHVLLTLTFGSAGVGMSSCALQPSESAEQSLADVFRKERILYSKSESGQVIPERVARFLDTAHRFGTGVRTYRLGSYQKSVTDCSGFIGQAHRSAGYGVLTFQFDYDPLNFTTCSGGMKPGDVVLLAYPGRQPDHWILMADVKSPQGKFHHSSNVIMDVSSDSIAGHPYFKGELGRRRNLMARQVYACRRHRAFARDWKELERQLQEDARLAAEKQKADESQAACGIPAESSPPRGLVIASETEPAQQHGCTTPSHTGLPPVVNPTVTPTPTNTPASTPPPSSAASGGTQVF